jgi:hypothetical protein
MIKLKRQIRTFITPTKNTWFILKITGYKVVDREQLNNCSKNKATDHNKAHKNNSN